MRETPKQKIKRLQEENAQIRRDLDSYSMYFGNQMARCKRCKDLYPEGYICHCGQDNSQPLPQQAV